VNIDFGTLCMISVPGFLIGLTAGRFICATTFREFKRRLGPVGRLLGGVAFAAYLMSAAITLAIMVIYLLNLPDAAKPASFWVTIVLAFWIGLNILFDLRKIFRRRDSVEV
jgi:hypothetical protein